ncbi:VanZ family protein [Mumia quercus]|uniref:VanZ family protein n=1 Tax=Mumia quercus TaxID=2976125 RepID=UPI0021CE8B14|nr:VanZ family protein [Mumia quercus]
MIAGRYGSVGLVVLALLPIAALAAWVLARGRLRAGLAQATAWRTAVAEVGIVYGTAPWVWLTMEPGSKDGVNFSLLRDLVGMPPYQVVGNLLVFAAFGFFAPLRFPALASVPRVLAAAAVGSLVIETLQYVLPMGRVSSVDDVLLNSAGAGLAALASRRWWRHPG